MIEIWQEDSMRKLLHLRNQRKLHRLLETDSLSKDETDIFISHIFIFITTTT
jgi:hypothetical protein